MKDSDARRVRRAKSRRSGRAMAFPCGPSCGPTVANALSCLGVLEGSSVATVLRLVDVGQRIMLSVRSLVTHHGYAPLEPRRGTGPALQSVSLAPNLMSLLLSPPAPKRALSSPQRVL